MSDRDAAGINSPHNACMFRADCRKAEAEIARLRENVAPVISSRASSEQTRRCEWCGEIAQGECGCAAETEIARLREDAERYRWLRQGEHGQPRTRLMQYHHDIYLDKAIDAARKDAK